MPNPESGPESLNKRSEIQSLIDVRRVSDGRFLMTSNLIPALVTEGRGENDSLKQLADALGLLLQVAKDTPIEVAKDTHPVFASLNHIFAHTH